MTKLYLIEQSSGEWDFYNYWVDSVWDCPIKAEERKKELMKQRDLVLLKYFEKYGTEYERDVELEKELMNFEKWDDYTKLHKRILNFQTNNRDILDKHEPTITEIELNKVLN